MREPDGFGEFVAANSRALLRSAWLLTGDWTTAEDLVQTALAAAWPRWTTIDTPLAYVRRSMVTTYLRWRKRRWTGEIAVAELPDRVVPESDAEVRRVLLDALRGLTRQQRAAVVLRYFADLSEVDTANALGCSVGTVKSHTARGVAKLRSVPTVAALLTDEVPR